MLLGFLSLFTIVGTAQEDGWTALTVGQSAYGIRYDTAGAVIVNNDVIMGCVPIPESYDVTLVVSQPSPVKKLVLVICSRGEGGDEAYIIDTVRNRVASRDVVPEHWQIRHWVSWSPDERFALVMAAGEVTNGDMVFVDLQTGKAEEVEFKTITNNPQIKQDIMGEIQDFDSDRLSWINNKTFRLRLDVHCNPYQLGDAQCDRKKILRSLDAQINLNPFNISYGIGGSRTPKTRPQASARGSRAGKGMLKGNSDSLTSIRQFDGVVA